jgi:four helix bundle protein
LDLFGVEGIVAKGKVDHFTDLDVWRKSHELFLEVLKELDGLPRTRAASALTDQIVRSLGSIGANIAEGFNRRKAKFLNSLDIALGEANESENWLYKLRDMGFLPRERANAHVRQCIEVQKMLGALMRAIHTRPDQRPTSN